MYLPPEKIVFQIRNFKQFSKLIFPQWNISFRTFTIFFSMIILLGGCAYYNTLFNANNSYKEALKAMQENPDPDKVAPNAKKHFETTIEKCWKLIDIYTEKSKYADDALLLIAKSEYYIQRNAQAKLHLEQFISKYGKSESIDEAQLWYAKTLLREDKPEEANDFFLLVLSSSKDSKIRSEANFALGVYAFEQENYQQAIEHLEKALKEKIDDEFKAQLLFQLGESYFIQDDYKNAIEQYKKVEKFSPALDIEYRTKLNLAKSYSKSGKFDDAYKVLRKMLTAPRFKPFVANIKTAIGENYETQNKLEDAIAKYDEVIRDRKPGLGTAQASFNLAKIYEYQYNQIDSAVTYYGKVAQFYNKFDSLEVAENKRIFLSEFKEIRDKIQYEEKMVFRLENEPGFRDSLYQAQYEDSLGRAQGTIQDRPQQNVANRNSQNANSNIDDLGNDGINNVASRFSQTYQDSLQRAQQDSLNRLGNLNSNSQNAGIGNNPQNDPNNQNQDQQEEESFGFRGNNQNQEEDDRNPNANSQSSGQNSRFGQGSEFNRNNPNNRNNRNNRQQEQEKKKPLEKRKLPEFEFDLMNNRYHLAEYYLLKVQNFDSAAHHYHKFLETYEDTILTPKALYSLVYIYRSPGNEDLARVYSLEKELLSNYIDSEFAQEIMKNKGMFQVNDKSSVEEEAQKLFLEAESLYFAGKYNQALAGYKQVAQFDTTWDISAKAQFATAWVYEHGLAMGDSALAAYKRLIDRYPNAREYVMVARKKTTPPVESKPASPDSTMLASTTPTDSLPSNLPGRTSETAGASRPGLSTSDKIEYADILQEKIRWRLLKDSGGARRFDQ